MERDVNIGIVGAGGDGAVFLGGLLLKIVAKQGYYASREQHVEAQIKGGGSAVKLCIKKEPFSMPLDNLDILVCFSWEKYLTFSKELPLCQETIILHESEALSNSSLPGKFVRVEFSRATSKNMVALGLLVKMFGLPEQEFQKVISEEFAFLDQDSLAKNLSALKLGESFFDEVKCPRVELPVLENQSPKIVLHGNEAIARGAIKAGCRFVASYPITPSVEAMDYFRKEFSRLKGVFVQAEDEIASMGLAIGASLVGVKAMDITSGPGLDLKTEMIGLGVTDEIPLVLLDVQRAGPSTGIPAKTEQSDLNQAIYSGHGDAPRVVLAPYDLEGCYRLAIEAFNISEYYQVPVIMLSDQWLSQTLVAVDADFLARDRQIINRKKPGQAEKGSYRRYLYTPDFISPMADAGDEGLAYQTRGLSHNEKGEPAQNQETSQLMHEKRWKKLLALKERKDLVRILGSPAAKIGIISWGSSGQAVYGAVKTMGLDKDIKVCIPELICPLPEKMIDQFSKSVKRLLVVEMNYSGQFYHYLRSMMELPADTRVYQRAGGRPFSFRELSEKIQEALNE